MGLDDLFRSDLQAARAELGEREKRRDAALRRLQHVGKQAYDALQAEGCSSERVARAIGVTASTIRKLNSDGDKTGWRPLSHKVYAALDAYTLRRLERTWDLARFRRAFDDAKQELEAAQDRLAESSTRADGGLPDFALGILLIPGVPEPRVNRSLERFGNALAGSFSRAPGGPSVTVAETHLETGGGGPARLVLQRGPGGGQDSGGQDSKGPEHRWMVAVSSLDHGLTDDRDLRDFLWWLLRASFPVTAEILDRRLGRREWLPGIGPYRWFRNVASAVLTGLIGFPVFLAGLALVFLCLVALTVPVARVAGRAGARLLARGVGLTFAYSRGDVALDAQINRVAEDLRWLTGRCEKVVVVTHGQGAPVAHGLVRRAEPGTVAVLVTMGSALRRFWSARELEGLGYPEKAFAGFHGLYTRLVAGAATVLLVSGAVELAVGVAFVVGGDHPLLALGAAATAGAFLAAAGVFVVSSRRTLHGEALQVRRLGPSNRRDLEPWPERLPWLDLTSPADPVADGPWLAVWHPLGEVPVGVTHHASAWADHRAYLRPDTEAFRRLLGALTRVAPPPAGLRPAGGVVSARTRVRWLVAARWVAALSGLPAAIVLTPRLPGSAPHGWLAAAAFAGLWAAAAAAALAAAHGCWKIWDFAQRNHEIDAALGATGRGVHVYAGFVLLVQAMVLAVMWPAMLVWGWWGTLADLGVAAAAFMHEGSVWEQVWILFGEAGLVLVITTTPGTLLLAQPAIRGWFERQAPRPNLAAAVALLLRLLPEDGIVVNGHRYRAAPISWDVAVRRFGRRGQPRRCPTPARTLLRDDAVLVDLREGHVEDGRVASVHGRQVHDAGASGPRATGDPRPAPRLAGVREWRAFRRDVPRLLEQVAAFDPTGGYAAEWEARSTLPRE